MEVIRLGSGPIITPELSPSIGTNIQGPSLIAAPAWIPEPLGRYYLYFADHKGGHVRLAFADELAGPWQIYEPGALQLADSCFLTEPPAVTDDELRGFQAAYQRLYGDYSLAQVLEDSVTPHIASPDVHVDEANQQVRMYFHGLDRLAVQSTRVATSTDGVHFQARPEVLGPSYFRVFEYNDWFYALVMPGQIRRSRDGLGGFERGPTLFEPTMRHSAALLRGDVLHVLWTRVGDAPESLLYSQIDLGGDWLQWRNSDPITVLSAEHDWEGARAVVEPSRRGAINTIVNQLRDPALFVESGRVFVLYAAAGESCIGLAEITL